MSEHLPREERDKCMFLYLKLAGELDQMAFQIWNKGRMKSVF